MQKSFLGGFFAGDGAIGSGELAAFPARFPILRRDGGRATLMARKDVTIRKVGAAGSAEHNLSTGSFISLHKPELMLVFDHRL